MSGVTGQRVVASRFVVDRADDGRLVHPPRRPRHEFANLHARDVRANGLELASDLLRRIRLQIIHVLRGRSAQQIHEDYALGLARPDVLILLEREQARQVEGAAQERQGARLESFAASHAITQTAPAA